MNPSDLLHDDTDGDAPPNPGLLIDAIAERHWVVIARHAWQQYQKRGRGVIVFPTPGDDAGSADQGTAPLRYLTFNGTDDQIASSGMRTLHRLTTTYDPEQHVVLAIVLPDERTVFDVYDRDPAPVDTE
ncbi:MAG: hypothetical protein PPP56_11200 [Longimonas sp.]|uniref:hypothetical protein n=1 Tax=Longimonas sp. TaxID=2039626 RepID=UPI003362680F